MKSYTMMIDLGLTEERIITITVEAASLAEAEAKGRNIGRLLATWG